MCRFPQLTESLRNHPEVILIKDTQSHPSCFDPISSHLTRAHTPVWWKSLINNTDNGYHYLEQQSGSFKKACVHPWPHSQHGWLIFGILVWLFLSRELAGERLKIGRERHASSYYTNRILLLQTFHWSDVL